MILSITLNPSMDYIYLTENFQLGKMTRFPSPTKAVGGKGINAGRTAALLGSQVILTGFLGGDNGKIILRDLQKEDIFELEFVEVAGENRNAITIMHDNNTHTELVEAGPSISIFEEDKLYKKLTKIAEMYTDISTIIISGSVNSADNSFYQKLLAYVSGVFHSKVKILMDISGKQLWNVLHSSQIRPSFIKPNIYELGELLNIEINQKKQVTRTLSSPLFDGIETVMISCGEEGAIVKHQKKIYDLTIPLVDVVNPTGSGDATVGGMAFSLEQGFDICTSLKYAMACGISNAKHEKVGVVYTKEIQTLLNHITIQKIKQTGFA